MVRFTVFGDLHYDEVSDGEKRVAELTEHIKEVQPNFVISLGDLCSPIEDNKEIVLKKFRKTGITMYHTIGNHETDACCLDRVIDFLAMPSPYYSFSYKDVKFIVLNSCYIRFSHHSLVNNHRDRGIYNREEIRMLFQGKDVLLCMNGHDHGDEFVVVDDIPYYTVNSATYVWCGHQIAGSDKLKDKYGYLHGMLLYKQVLYVDVEIDDNEIRIQGMNGDYLSVTPEDVELYDYRWNGVSIKAQTSSRVISRKVEK